MKLEKELKQAKFLNQYQKLIVNIIFTGNWVQSSNAKFLKPYNLTTQQYNVLKILGGKYPEAVNINTIAERMLDPTSNASRLVEKLRQKKLVERKISKEDRRQAEVVLTKEGINLLKKIEEKFISFEELLTSVSPEEAEILNRLLDKLRQ